MLKKYLNIFLFCMSTIEQCFASIKFHIWLIVCEVFLEGTSLAWACDETEKAQTTFTSLRIIVADTVLTFISVKMYLFNKHL
jgi:hypothetical protein